ncbi:MAG: hypothetical protein WC179_09060 [Candidatus Cloacimonadaceae bacterium]|jgi:small neutral amino acid transporter SnatA (MarC family)|nr:hypothetical protein [Acholeplasmataceae bacterium]MDD4194414.1 hypothetical protein [Acholeplasmataceae bacterium]
METLAIILIVYGAFMLLGLILQFPFFYRMKKAEILIKLLGKTGYNILILVMGLAALIIGIILIT